MARRGKVFIANEIYFITFTILNWTNIFINDKYCNFVYKWFDYMKKYYGNKINGYVIMPSHIHLLIKITDKSPKLSTLIMNSKRFLAYQIVKELRKDNYFYKLKLFKNKASTIDGAHHKCFMNRYDSLIIQSHKMFLQKLNYIHNNPCSEYWGLAERQEDYKHSSASNYICGHGVYDVKIVDI
jgi:REP element-mobilizing transposase RayT